MPTYRSQVATVSTAVQTVRDALRPVLDRVLPAGYGARSCGRALKMSVSNGWRCWTIAHTSDPAMAMRAMPGRRGWTQIMRALSDKGADAGEIAQLTAAIDQLDKCLADEGISNATLRAMGASADGGGRRGAELRTASRRAYSSFAKLYGVHASTLVTATILTPTPEPNGIRLAVVNVLDGLRRIRPGLPWPSLTRSGFFELPDGKARYYEGLGDNPAMPQVLSSLTTGNAIGRELIMGCREGRDMIELSDLPSTVDAPIRICTAELSPPASLGKSGQPEHVSLHTTVHVPIPLLVLDVILHKRIQLHLEPSSLMYAGAPTSLEGLRTWSDLVRLPLDASMELCESTRLPKRIAHLDAPYFQALSHAMDAQQEWLAEYDIYRVTIPHPPALAGAAVTFEVAGIAPPAGSAAAA